MPRKIRYLIDTENIGSAWTEVLPLMGRNDEILLFYTVNSPGIPYRDLQQIMNHLSQMELIPCNTGRNGLDFQLSSYLGYLLRSSTKTQYVILSKDTGYDPLIQFWKEKGVDIARCAVHEVIELRAREADAPARLPEIAAADTLPAPARLQEAPAQKTAAPASDQEEKPVRRTRQAAGKRGAEAAPERKAAAPKAAKPEKQALKAAPETAEPETKVQQAKTTQPDKPEARAQQTKAAQPAKSETKVQQAKATQPDKPEAKVQQAKAAQPAKPETKAQQAKAAQPAKPETKAQQTKAAQPAKSETKAQQAEPEAESKQAAESTRTRRKPARRGKSQSKEQTDAAQDREAALAGEVQGKMPESLRSQEDVRDLISIVRESYPNGLQEVNKALMSRFGYDSGNDVYRALKPSFREICGADRESPAADKA